MSAPQPSPPVTGGRPPVISFVLDLTERAVKTAAQAALGVTGVLGPGMWTAHWQEAAGVVLVASVTSVLTSLSSVSVGDRTSASLVGR